jgi:hypothetical protein
MDLLHASMQHLLDKKEVGALNKGQRIPTWLPVQRLQIAIPDFIPHASSIHGFFANWGYTTFPLLPGKLQILVS